MISCFLVDPQTIPTFDGTGIIARAGSVDGMRHPLAGETRDA